MLAREPRSAKASPRGRKAATRADGTVAGRFELVHAVGADFDERVAECQAPGSSLSYSHFRPGRTSSKKGEFEGVEPVF
jgi:hypothetical protein